MKRKILIKSLIGMITFLLLIVIFNYSATNTIEVVAEISYIQCTLTVGIFIMVYNFYKEWKESQSQDDNKP